MEIQQKLEEYEHFVEEKLKGDLRDIESVLIKKSTICKEWTELKNVIAAVSEFKANDKDMNIQVNLGNDISSFAKICDYEDTYVDIGLGCILEMNCEEANKYSDIRIKLLQKEIRHLRQLAVNVKVHIKMVLLAISELQATLVNKK